MAGVSANLETLLTQCQTNNDVLQKETLYKTYYGYLKGVLKRYVNDYQAVEELINDSFIKIFSNLHTFNANPSNNDISHSFKSWIARIASRTAIDFLRKKKIQFIEEDAAEKQLYEPNQAESTTGVKEILTLLNQLPDIQKTVFNLYEIEGFSHEEIAKMLSISESVSRVYLSRAKNRLKSLYIKHY